MALNDDINAATDHSSRTATTAANAAIDKVNVTRAAIAAANAAADLPGAIAALAGEATTALPHMGVPSIDRAVGDVSGPAAMGQPLR